MPNSPRGDDVNNGYTIHGEPIEQVMARVFPPDPLDPPEKWDVEESGVSVYTGYSKGSKAAEVKARCVMCQHLIGHGAYTVKTKAGLAHLKCWAEHASSYIKSQRCVIDTLRMSSYRYTAERESLVASLTTQYDEALAACAGMREALEGFCKTIDELEGDVPDSALHLGVYDQQIVKAVAALSSTAGADMLKRVKAAESVVEAARGLLKRVADLHNVRIDPSLDQHPGEQAAAWGADLMTTLEAIDAYLKGGGK